MKASNKSSHLSRTVVDLFRLRLPMNGRRLFTLMAALLLFPVMMPAFTVGDFEYSLISPTERTVRVGGVKGLSGNVVIPKTVTLDGVTYTVTRIADNGFEKFTAIESVTIPASVKTIGGEAFFGCTGLTSVTIPSSVETFGSSVFASCTGLTSVTIPASVTEIPVGTFSGCTGLTGVTIPSSVTSIGSYVFNQCSGLTSVTIPASVTAIGSRAFCLCTGLTSVTIPASVTSIGGDAFYGCNRLTSITIPASVKTIGSFAFACCNGLTSVTIPSSVTEILEGAFYGCPKLTTVVSEITEPFQTGENAFDDLPANARLLVPSGAESKYASLSDWSRFTNLGGIHAIVRYPIEVCGMQVTDANKDDVLAGYSGRYSQKGKVSYDPDTKVLTLDNVTLYHNGLYTLQTRNWRGSIELKGANRIVNEDWYALSMADGTITSSTGTGSLQCTGDDAGMEIDGTYSHVYIRNCSVSIDGLLYGLEGSGGTLHIEGSEVTVRNTYPTSSSAKGSIYGVTLETDGRICRIVSPANVKYDSSLKGYVVSGESSLTKEPVVVSYKRDRYGLYICGDEVTASNCTDVTGSWLKRGKVSYDPRSATLTLDNVLTDCPDEIAIQADEYYMGHGITINLVGDNRLTGSSDSRFAYLALGGGWEVGMTISSSSGGTLRADHIFCSAVFPLTIRDCAVRLDGYIEDDDPVRLVVDNAALIVGSPGNAPKARYVYWIQRPLELNGSYIAWPENGYNEDGFIYDAKGNKVTDYVAILPDGKTLDDYDVKAGDVNEDGKVDINDVVAVINVMAGTATWPKANVNGDTKVDINDVVAVINIMAGN